MRKITVVSSLLLALFVPALGLSAPGGVQAAKDTSDYILQDVILSQGSELVFANLDPFEEHTITEGDPEEFGHVPLFNSGRVAARSVATIAATASLAPGDYFFFCDRHYQMQAYLHVQ